MRRTRFALALLVGLCWASQAVSQSEPEPSPTPADFAISIVGNEVRLAWTLPDPASGNTEIKLLRRLNTPPTGPDDAEAELLLAGAATEYSHSIQELLPDVAGSPRTYYYTGYGCGPGGTPCTPVGSEASLRPTLILCLMGGGYTIYWRHADADVCVDKTELGTAANTSVPDWWRSCDSNCETATARQVNSTGLQRATFIGDQFQAIGIPVGRVISSEYCRCLQTAEAMDFGPTIETNPGITFFVYDESNRCANAFELVREAPAAGTNVAIVGHSGFMGGFNSCLPLSTMASAECAIFKPDGLGDATLIARMTWAEWGNVLDVPASAKTGSSTALDAPFEFPGGLRIRYRIASESPVPVRLEAFDLRGRRVWSAPQGFQGRGMHDGTWDRRDKTGLEVPSGVYFIRLHAGPVVASRKALILRR